MALGRHLSLIKLFKFIPFATPHFQQNCAFLHRISKILCLWRQIIIPYLKALLPSLGHVAVMKKGDEKILPSIVFVIIKGFVSFTCRSSNPLFPYIFPSLARKNINFTPWKYFPHNSNSSLPKRLLLRALESCCLLGHLQNSTGNYLRKLRCLGMLWWLLMPYRYSFTQRGRKKVDATTHPQWPCVLLRR